MAPVPYGRLKRIRRELFGPISCALLQLAGKPLT